MRALDKDGAKEKCTTRKVIASLGSAYKFKHGSEHIATRLLCEETKYGVARRDGIFCRRKQENGREKMAKNSTNSMIQANPHI